MKRVVRQISELDIIERCVDPAAPLNTAEAAKSILQLRFADRDKLRMKELASRARSGNLTDDEQNEIEAFGRIDCLLSMLHSKAKLTLGKKPSGNGARSRVRK